MTGRNAAWTRNTLKEDMVFQHRYEICYSCHFLALQYRPDRPSKPGFRRLGWFNPGSVKAFWAARCSSLSGVSGGLVECGFTRRRSPVK